MDMRTWPIFMGTLFWLLLPAARLAALNEEGLAELVEKSECINITMAYPDFGMPKLDAHVSAWAESYFREMVEDYKQYCLEDPELREKSADWTLSVKAKEIKSTPGTVSMYFRVYGYVGGAYPNQGTETLILDMEGQRLGYEDLFDTTEGLWAFLADRAGADLRRQAKQAGGNPEAAPLTLPPKLESFKYFLVTPGGLTLIFPADPASADADEAAVEQRSDVSLKALARFNPKPGLWDAPQAVTPPFDCAQPANRAEAEICVNPILALYDAEIAREYARVLEVVDKEALQKEQNLWRQMMQSRCDSDPVSLCLFEYYRLRLDKLRGIKAAL